MGKGRCSFCDNGNKYDIDEAHCGRLGNTFICRNCLEQLKDLLELYNLNKEITSLKGSLTSLREDTEYEHDELEKRVENLEKTA